LNSSVEKGLNNQDNANKCYTQLIKKVFQFSANHLWWLAEITNPLKRAFRRAIQELQFSGSRF
jgi:hypothetical protein